MPDLRLRVQPYDELGTAREYAGWKAARITRSIECVAGSFDLAVSDRWNGRDDPWPIGEEDEVLILVDGKPVIWGYVDRRSLSLGAQEHTLSVSGRDRTGLLVDCSAVLKKWEYLGVPLMTLAKRLCEPFGITVTLQPGLVVPPLTARLSIDPGDSAFDALERACRVAGVLPVSDGAGGLLLTRAGTARATTELVQGKNILHASAQYDATGRHRRYLVLAQHPGNDENMGDATASVMGTAKDPKVRRAERVLAIRAETAMTPAIAAQRASWEATVRAARGDALSVTVQGWHQADGTLWPVNAKVQVDLPTIGAKGEMLIAAATHSLDDKSGTTTELRLLDPKAFTPEPTVPGGQWKELRKGV